MLLNGYWRKGLRAALQISFVPLVIYFDHVHLSAGNSAAIFLLSQFFTPNVAIGDLLGRLFNFVPVAEPRFFWKKTTAQLTTFTEADGRTLVDLLRAANSGEGASGKPLMESDLIFLLQKF